MRREQRFEELHSSDGPRVPLALQRPGYADEGDAHWLVGMTGLGRPGMAGNSPLDPGILRWVFFAGKKTDAFFSKKTPSPKTARSSSLTPSKSFRCRQLHSQSLQRWLPSHLYQQPRAFSLVKSSFARRSPCKRFARGAPPLRCAPVALPGQTFVFPLERLRWRAGFVGAESAWSCKLLRP